jgi:hypothetical protein
VARVARGGLALIRVTGMQIFEIARAVCTWMRTQARLRSNTMAVKLRVEVCQAIREKPIDTPPD